MSEQQEEFLTKMAAALGGGQPPSQFAEDLRSQGIAVVQHPVPVVPPVVPPVATVPTPAPTVGTPPATGATQAPPAISADDLAELAAARMAPVAADPRIAWREQQVQAIVARGLMPEAMARVVVNTAKKADLEAWMAQGAAVGSPVPPQGQAPPLPGGAPLQTPAQGAAQVAGQPPPVDPLIAELRAEVADLRRGVFGKDAKTHLDAFTAAGAELRDLFPRMVLQDGSLEPRVKAVAKQLLQLPEFRSASEKQILQAAGSAVFSIEPAANAAPVTPSPRTPVPGGDLGGERRPLTNPEIAVLVMELRTHHGNGNPHSLTKAQQAAVDADLARIVAARR